MSLPCNSTEACRLLFSLLTAMSSLARELGWEDVCTQICNAQIKWFFDHLDYCNPEEVAKALQLAYDFASQHSAGLGTDWEERLKAAKILELQAKIMEATALIQAYKVLPTPEHPVIHTAEGTIGGHWFGG